MTQSQKIHQLEEARENLQSAFNLISEVFPDDGNIKAYFLDKLEIMICEDHGFLSMDLNIDKLIQEVEKGDE